MSQPSTKSAKEAATKSALIYKCEEQKYPLSFTLTSWISSMKLHAARFWRQEIACRTASQSRLITLKRTGCLPGLIPCLPSNT
jgi:hypothetical protein